MLYRAVLVGGASHLRGDIIPMAFLLGRSLRLRYNFQETSIDAKEASMAIDKEQVSRVLDLIRPSLQADGGDVALVDVQEDGVVVVELQGACKGCPMSQMTLANGVERILKEHVPGVTKVVPA